MPASQPTCAGGATASQCSPAARAAAAPAAAAAVAAAPVAAAPVRSEFLRPAAAAAPAT